MSSSHQLAAFTTALARNSQTEVIYADANGAIGFWNIGAEVLFGHSAAETSGRRVDLIVPDEYRTMHWAGFNRTIGSLWRGSAAWGPVEGLHKDGSRVALEVFLTPIHEEDDRAVGVLAFFRTVAR